MPQSATTLPLDGSIVARGRRNAPKARAVPPIVNELEEVRAWRHALHAHPEVAFEVWMLQKIPGNFTWLGAGVTNPALHTASFDFNDDLLPLGISYWQKLVRRFLASKATA
ncbi:MAG TPA: hypothetical protein VKP30_14740 [Polyangiaceae bacterium]|nr:hypothetical protein [Polyangiaceae bacterium]